MDGSPPQSGGSLRLPAAERRNQLVATAMRVFAAEGFHRTSMDEIARAAGVTKPVLYQHFGSKRELYLELLDDVGGRLLAAIAKATAAASNPRQQVEYGFRAYFRFVADEPAAFTLLFGSGARRDEQFSDAVRRLEAEIAEGIAPLIDADIDHEQRLLLAHALVGVAESTSRRWVSGRLDLDPDQVAAQVADLAWSGLRGVRRI